MAYKEKQLNGNSAKALSQAWGSTNAGMAGKKKQSAEKKKGAAKKAGNSK